MKKIISTLGLFIIIALSFCSIAEASPDRTKHMTHEKHLTKDMLPTEIQIYNNSGQVVTIEAPNLLPDRITSFPYPDATSFTDLYDYGNAINVHIILSANGMVFFDHFVGDHASIDVAPMLMGAKMTAKIIK